MNLTTYDTIETCWIFADHNKPESTLSVCYHHDRKCWSISEWDFVYPFEATRVSETMAHGVINAGILHKEGFELVELHGCWRYVNHRLRLATTGFGRKSDMLANAYMIRFDKSALGYMGARYAEYFPAVKG